MTGLELASVFFDELPRARDGSAADSLAAMLDEIVAAGRAAWPALELSSETFVRHVARKVGDSDDVAVALGEVRAPELFLACACAGGDAAAIRAFEQRYFGDIAPALMRLAKSAEQADELAQRMREKLFVGSPERPPRIGDYSGRGDLGSWMRAAIARTALDLLSRGPKERAAPDELFASLPDAGADPEMDHLRQRYQNEFRQALASAVASLDPKDRNLLRYAFAHGLSIDEIGALYGVHRATAARWLAQARDGLARGVRSDLMARLSVDRAEIESIMRMVRSQLDITLSRYFLSGSAKPPLD
jgi:RNA polymerase sigma-70 factor (ECF subfamily)